MSTQTQTLDENPSTIASAGRIPALDAVRGLAILMVTFFRFFPPLDDPSLAGRASTHISDVGSRGVDLFFVLSGFLITGILYDSKGQSHYFRNFYVRRALRIFPLYYGVLFVTLIVLPGIGLALSPDFAKGLEYCPWLWLYGTNIPIAWQGDWCIGAFNHFWSLAVEEHFYLVWPLVIFLCSRKTAMRVCLGAIGLSFVARTVWLASGGNEITPHAFTLFRIDALALGGLLALVARGPNGLAKIKPWALCACLVLVVLMAPPIYAQGRFPMLRESMYAALFGSLIVLAVAATKGGRWSRLWGSAILRFFGKYSYGMYVFQNLLKVAFVPGIYVASFATGVGSIFWARIVYLILMSLATILISLASWHLVEKHFLKLKALFEYSSTERTSRRSRSAADPDLNATEKNLLPTA